MSTIHKFKSQLETGRLDARITEHTGPGINDSTEYGDGNDDDGLLQVVNVNAKLKEQHALMLIADFAAGGFDIDAEKTADGWMIKARRVIPTE